MKEAEKHELMVIEPEPKPKGLIHDAVVGLLTLAPLILIAIGVGFFMRNKDKE